MKIVFATDHAGFALKEALVPFVRDELGFEVTDIGALAFDPDDDYPAYMAAVAAEVAADPEGTRAIILGGSGQGEAVVANRFRGVRAVVYYGPSVAQVDADGTELDMIASTRRHTDANVLSLGARFLSEEQAKDAVRAWLETPFAGEERHVRRITSIDDVT